MKMGWKRCIVCDSTNKLEDVTFHKFPLDEKWRRKWCQSLRIRSQDITKGAVVCSKHFPKEDLRIHDSKVYIRMTSVPLPLNSGNVISQESICSQHPQTQLKPNAPKKDSNRRALLNRSDGGRDLEITSKDCKNNFQDNATVRINVQTRESIQLQKQPQFEFHPVYECMENNLQTSINRPYDLEDSKVEIVLDSDALNM